jgi:hypothetical protein
VTVYPVEAVGRNGLVSFDGRVIEVFGQTSIPRVHLFHVTAVGIDGDQFTFGFAAPRSMGNAHVTFDPAARPQFEALVAAVNEVLASWRSQGA